MPEKNTNEQIREIIKRTGLSMRAFGIKYHIPYTTIQGWLKNPESDAHRTPPEYVPALLKRVVEIDYPEE